MTEGVETALAAATGHGIALAARLVTAVRGIWDGVAPVAGRQRIYFANHASNADFVLIWTVLPERLRRTTRPVAARDYWDRGRLRRFIINRVFRGVLIDRKREDRVEDPIEAMVSALGEGSSLIIFPEGTRNTTGKDLLPLRPGLFKLAEARPGAELVPVWIENLNRVMPKGEIVPLPLLCTVAFGDPLERQEGEDCDAFLARATDALHATRALTETAS